MFGISRYRPSASAIPTTGRHFFSLLGAGIGVHSLEGAEWVRVLPFALLIGPWVTIHG